MMTLSGVFVSLESAERACRQLESHGIGSDRLSLILDEDCPACAHERDSLSMASGGYLSVGQGIGSLLGVALGLLAVFGPQNAWLGGERGAIDPVAFSLFDWMLRLFILGSWGLSFGLMGGMLAGAVKDAWESLRRRNGDKPLHSHYVLTVATPAARAGEVGELLKARGGRLVETPAMSKYPSRD